jgi:hypothetical protein
MKERPKLGRGLQDVSSFFLTGTSQPGQELKELSSPVDKTRSVCICYPASPLIQSVVMANLALELVRHRNRVIIKDFSTTDETRLSTLMGSLLTSNDKESGRACVNLYGLPEILIIDSGPDGPINNEVIQDISAEHELNDDTDCINLLNMAASRDLILSCSPLDDYIIITKTDEKSLLQCYVYIKILYKHCASGRVHVIFDDVAPSFNGDSVFKKFSGFIHERMGLKIHCLGSLLHDEHFMNSINAKRPLVLYNGTSTAKDMLMGISSLLLGSNKNKED